MKKNNMIFLIIYSIIGIILMIAGITANIDYYSSMMFAMGFACLTSSIVQLLRQYRDSRPENAETVREKQRRQAINLKDERNIQLRHQAGYMTFQITTIGCFIGASITALVRVDAWIVGSLFLLAIVQYIIAGIIYKYLCEKM